MTIALARSHKDARPGIERAVSRPFRIAVLNTHPIQYFAPLYAYLNATPDLDITAFYLSDISLRGGHDPGFRQTVTWDVDLLSGYRSVFTRGAKRTDPGLGFFSIFAPELWRIIRSGRYDALWLHGHAYAANILALAAARSVGIPVLMRCETHLGLPRGRLKNMARRSALAVLYGQCDRLLAIGSANTEFYRAMGVASDKIFLVPYVVDNDRFTINSTLDAAERSLVRSRLGITDELPVMLYASKLQRRKRPADLIHAFHKLTQSGIGAHLLIVGSGELEEEMKALAASLAVPRVHFAGFINQNALPKIYAACDVFVLPSEGEPWGLVVNEAMCAGLPIVAADGIGSVKDLVRPGQNGATFTAGDLDGLCAVLRPVLEDARLREAMSRRSREIVSGWGFDECLSGIRAALADLPLVQRNFASS